jgi:hypothetical protein
VGSRPHDDDVVVGRVPVVVVAVAAGVLVVRA